MRAAGMVPVAVLTAALCLWAQGLREDYRNAYKAWRQSDPNLERDAAAGAAGFAARVQTASSQAVKYETARKAFLEQMAAASQQEYGWLETAAPEPPIALSEGAQAFVASEIKAVKRNADVFAGDPDPGIQQLRGMLLRENSALAALSTAMMEREKAAAAATTSSEFLERTRSNALDAVHAMIGGWNDQAEQTVRESAAWTEYYALLEKDATPPPAPSVVVPSAPRATAATEPAASETPAPATPVPMARYIGAWTYPPVNGLYHGTEPEFADLVVQDNGGHATGTFFARFRLDSTATEDPVLRFNFTGEFSDQRIQELTIQMSDGSKGRLELIPGPAFNLLEINFQIDARPGRIHQGNMVLVKK